jgi:hypothetical protein
MTEEEAKTKWCPFVRHAEDTNQETSVPAFNRLAEPLRYNLNCVGSDCMAWRYVNRPVDGHGYCGLAGK